MELFFSLSILLIALLLVITFSLFCSALLRMQSVPVNILSVYLLSFFNIILVSEIAGTLSLLRNQFFFLFLHFILVGITFLVWRRSGCPPVFDAYVRAFKKYKFGDVLSSIKAWPSVWILALVVGLFYLFGAFLILKVPPNNYDSMTSHMVRVAYWLQHGNFQPWPTWDFTQQVYPINAQVAIMWTILFLGRDKLAGFPQWLSALTAMVAIFGIVRVLGWNRIQSVFAALVWAFLPEILLQSTTTQNHLVASSLFVIMVYLLFLGMKEHNNWLLLLSGISLALALGTHQLIFMALPGLVLVLMLFWIRMGRVGLRLILIWVGWSSIAFLLTGSYMYIFNTAIYGDPLASNVFYRVTSRVESNTQNIRWDPAINIARYIYASFDLTGIPIELAAPIYEERTELAEQLVNNLEAPIEGGGFDLAWMPPFVGEDSAWFGILGFIIFPILFVQQLRNSIKHKDPFRGGLLLMIVGYIICFPIFFSGIRNAWSPYQGRYFIISSVLIAPFFSSLVRPSRLYKLIIWVMVILSVGMASYVMLFNWAKPLQGNNSIFKLDRVSLQGLNSGQFNAAVRVVDDNVPTDAKMGMVIYQGFFEYPFFGKYLARQLIPIYPYSSLYESGWLEQEKIDWILLCIDTPIPDGFVETSRFPAYTGECSLIRRKQ